MSRRVLLFLRGVLVLLQRRRRRLSQPPSSPADLLRLLLPLLPHGAEAEHTATASDSILALVRAAALRRLPPRLTFGGEEGRDPRLVVEVEGARQLLLSPHPRARIHVAPQVSVPLAVAGGMARRLLLLVRLLFMPARSADLVPLPLQRAAEPDQAESEDGTTLLAVLLAAGIRRLPRAPPLAIDLDNPRAVEALVGFIIQRVRAGAVAVAVAAAGEDAPPIHDHKAAVAREEDAPRINVDINLLIFNAILHRARRVAPPRSDNAFALRVLLRLPARTIARLLPPPDEARSPIMPASASLVGVVFYAALRRVDAVLPPGSDGFLRDVTNLLGPFSQRLLPPHSQNDHAVLLLPAPASLAVEPCPARIAADMWRAAAAVRAARARADSSVEHLEERAADIELEPATIDDDLASRVDASANLESVAAEGSAPAKIIVLTSVNGAREMIRRGDLRSTTTSLVTVDVPSDLACDQAKAILHYLKVSMALPSLVLGPVLSLMLD